MNENLEKQNFEIIAAVDNTFVDALNITALDLAGEEVNTDFYKVILNVFKELMENKRIRYVITQSALEASSTKKC